MLLNDYTVPGHDIKIRGTLTIASESLAGKSAATERVNNGIKPKSFFVKLFIKFKDAADLKSLIALAEATTENGEMQIYDVVDDTINAGNVRQVQFDANLTWKEDEQLHTWIVNFNVIEHKSVAEKLEQRQTLTDANAQQSEGEIVEPTLDIAEESQEPQESVVTATQTEEENLTGFESFLSHIDKTLAPDDNETA